VTSFLKCYPGDVVALLVANVLAQIAVVVILAGAISLTFARHYAAMRHAIWLCALVGVFVSPIVAYVAARANLSLVSLRLCLNLRRLILIQSSLAQISLIAASGSWRLRAAKPSRQ